MHLKRYSFTHTILILAFLSFQFSSQAETFSWKNVKIGGGGGFVPNVIYNNTQPGLVYARTNLLGGEAFATDPVDPKICYFAAETYTNDWTDMAVPEL